MKMKLPTNPPPRNAEERAAMKLLEDTLNSMDVNTVVRAFAKVGPRLYNLEDEGVPNTQLATIFVLAFGLMLIANPTMFLHIYDPALKEGRREPETMKEEEMLDLAYRHIADQLPDMVRGVIGVMDNHRNDAFDPSKRPTPTPSNGETIH